MIITPKNPTNMMQTLPQDDFDNEWNMVDNNWQVKSEDEVFPAKS